jgi:hypothetical protein
MLVREVRNAFFLSDCVLTAKSFNIREGEGVIIGRVIEKEVDLSWLMPRLELGINTVLATIDFAMEHIRSYKEDKMVRGRFSVDDSFADIQLTTRPNYGLVGFKTPPDTQMTRHT